jgi:tRNA(adenine34) deaminase
LFGAPSRQILLSPPIDDALDRAMMERCIELAREASMRGEYPYGAVICREGKIIAEGTSRVRADRDVTHHAELVAISAAQAALRTTSLDECTIYSNAEPCVQCAYAIRESRIRRVIFGISSPFIGGMSRWNVLCDHDISGSLSEVFAPPPVVIAGFMADEIEKALVATDPLVWQIIKMRGLFGHPVFPSAVKDRPTKWSRRLKDRAMAFLRRNFFDYFGRR